MALKICWAVRGYQIWCDLLRQTLNRLPDCPRNLLFPFWDIPFPTEPELDFAV